MDEVQVLEKKRQALLKQLGDLGSLRRGCLNEQWFPVVRQGQKTGELRGPYYVWTCKEGAKTASERVRGEAALERARQDEARYRAFKEILRDYESVAEQLGALERQEQDRLETLKKGLKSQKKPKRK